MVSQEDSSLDVLWAKARRPYCWVWSEGRDGLLDEGEGRGRGEGDWGH